MYARRRHSPRWPLSPPPQVDACTAGTAPRQPVCLHDGRRCVMREEATFEAETPSLVISLCVTADKAIVLITIVKGCWEFKRPMFWMLAQPSAIVEQQGGSGGSRRFAAAAVHRSWTPQVASHLERHRGHFLPALVEWTFPV